MHTLETSLPIKSITVYPGSARITRARNVDCKSGEQKISISGLPRSVTSDSIRVNLIEGSGITVRDVFSEEFIIEEYNENRFRTMREELIDLQNKQNELQVSLTSLTQDLHLFLTRKSVLSSIEKDAHKPVNVAAWKDFLSFMNEKLTANRDQFRKTLFEWLSLHHQIVAGAENLEQYQSYDRVVEQRVTVLIETIKECSELFSISYLQPDVFWHPVYTLRADLDKKMLSIAMHSMIKQTTSEDWVDVSLLLSTAIPLSNCDIPKISSRRIKEADTEIIMNEALFMSEDDEFGAMDDMECDDEEEERKEEPRMDLKKKSKPKKVSRKRGLKMSEEKELFSKSMGIGGKMDGLMTGDNKGGGSPMPPQSLQPSITDSLSSTLPGGYLESEEMAGEDQIVGGDFRIKDKAPGYSLDQSLAAIYALTNRVDGKILQPFSLDLLHAYYRQLYYFLQDQFNPEDMVPASTYRPVNSIFANGTSPLHSLGGYDYRYTVPGSSEIPSHDVPTQIGVNIKEVPMEQVYITIPLEKETVYLKATFANSGPNPYPAGPAQIFVGPEFLGNSKLPTLGNKQGTSISLGIERDIKVIRRENMNRRTKGLIGKDIVTDVSIEIELVNYKKEKVTIEVLDRIPRTNMEKEISISDEQHSPEPDLITKRKIIRWRLELAPGKKEIIKLSYAIKHPENFRLSMSRDSSPFKTL